MAKVGGVVLTHGHFGQELLSAAEMVVGEIPHVVAVSIGWHSEVETARHEIERAITQVSRGSGVLLLTDMFGGTPTNIAGMFLDDQTVEVLTGVNLPMLVKLATCGDHEELSQVTEQILQSGRSGIYSAGNLLAVGKTKK